jgi:hypothetical protein
LPIPPQLQLVVLSGSQLDVINAAPVVSFKAIVLDDALHKQFDQGWITEF